MDYKIRPEASGEYDTIHALVQTAFATAPVSDGTEQDFVRELRAGENYRPELALVAEQEGELIGHIMLTETVVEGAHGSFTSLLLAPVCVRLAERNLGVGGALIGAALEKARELGYTACFLVGDPAYYSHFGFRLSADFDIRPQGDIPAQYVQALELVPQALRGITGQVVCC